MCSTRRFFLPALGAGLLGLTVLAGCATATSSTPRPTEPTARSADAAKAKEPAREFPRLVMVSWDGGADWVVDRLLDEGRLPHLAEMVRRGARAEHSVTSFPSKTSVGHASIWTGCWADGHGVLNNRMPYRDAAEHSLVETLRGFDSAALTAEPLYVTAAKAGRKVVVLSATQSYPHEPHVETLRSAFGLTADAAGDAELAEHYRSISGFEHQLAEGELLGAEGLQAADAAWGFSPEVLESARELTTEVGDTALHVLFFDDPETDSEGLDSALIRVGSREPGEAVAEARIRPHPAERETPVDPREWWSAPLPVTAGEHRGNVFFRLFHLAPDGSEVALYRREVSAMEGFWPEPSRSEYLEAYPGFHDNPFWIYRDGGLGTPLMVGGDGSAERRALEIVAHDLALQTAGTRWALDALDPDVLFQYTPLSDGAGHVWLGVLHPDSPIYDAQMARVLWPYYARVFELQDAWLGAMMEASGEAVLALVSDHGMAGVDRYFYVNRVLERAGLLARTRTGEGNGKVDLSRTRALAPPVGSPWSVWINGTERLGGIVPPEEQEAVLDEVRWALLGFVDPETGVRPVIRTLDPADGALGEAEVSFGPSALESNGRVLYFDLAAGYYPQSSLGQDPGDPLVSRTPYSWGQGHHGYWPERRDMHAIFYLAGPGVAPGVTLPPTRHVDVAPTVARLVGLPAPPCTVGRAVEEVFAAPTP
ncbi:MAG: alkaline phosphatase family protein [Acidobacteriota bacterium]|nr:alkaline phosphatase family protein [Acidobacteriota bacterium]